MEKENYIHSVFAITQTFFQLSETIPINTERVVRHVQYLMRTGINSRDLILRHMAQQPITKSQLSIFDLLESGHEIIRKQNGTSDDHDLREGIKISLLNQVIRVRRSMDEAKQFGLEEFISEKQKELNTLTTVFNMTQATHDNLSTERF